MSVLRNMDDRFLIRSVRDHVAIYDPSHPQYMDIAYKDSIWMEIGKQLDQKGADCKTRWNNIRDNFRKVMNKRNSFPDRNRKYKYEDELDFLVGYYYDRGILRSLPESDPLENNKIEVTDTFVDLGESAVDDTVLNQHRKRHSVLIPQQLPQDSAKKFKPESAASTLMKYILDKNKEEKRPVSQESTDAVDLFLASLAPTLKSFSPYHLNISKTRIFAVVQEIELMEIQEQNSTSTAGACTSSNIS